MFHFQTITRFQCFKSIKSKLPSELKHLLFSFFSPALRAHCFSVPSRGVFNFYFCAFSLTPGKLSDLIWPLEHMLSLKPESILESGWGGPHFSFFHYVEKNLGMTNQYASGKAEVQQKSQTKITALFLSVQLFIIYNLTFRMKFMLQTLPIPTNSLFIG